MSKQKMQAARELIQQKRYDEARAILKAVDHPTAREWLRKLDTVAPENKPSMQKVYLYGGIGSLVVVILIVGVLVGMRASNSPAVATDTRLPTVTPTPILFSEALESLTIWCMQETEQTRSECTTFAGNVATRFPDTLAECNSRYADNLELFKVCMKDVLDVLEEEARTANFQVELLYRYCSGDGQAYTVLFSDDDCTEWATLVTSVYSDNVNQCWDRENAFDRWVQGGVGIIESALPFVNCLMNEISPFPPLPVCDNEHSTRATCPPGSNPTLIPTQFQFLPPTVIPTWTPNP